MNFSTQKLDRALNPKTVAVIGDKGKWNYQWLKSMSAFKGKVFSVQIDPREIPGIERMGIPNYPSLLEIPVEIDYVVVAVPRQASLGIIGDCIEKKVGGVSMFTAGFAETGSADGTEMQQTLSRMAREAGLVLIGPNCMGVYDPQIGLRFLPYQPTGGTGPLTFLSQSGGHGGTFSFAARANGIGVNKVVSFGNGAVMDVADFLEYFSQDDRTQIIGMYVEDVKNGRRFFEALRETTPRKPVLIWKGGQTAEGGQAASSHTGALAGSASVWSAVVNQCGAIAVDSMEELIDVAKALICAPSVTGNGLGIIVWSGGQSVSMTDAFAKANIRIPPLAQESYRKLETTFKLVGASCRNPIDLGGMNREKLRVALQILAEDENIDIVATQIGGVTTYREISQSVAVSKETLLEMKPQINKLLIALTISPDPFADGEMLGSWNRELLEGGIPVYVSHERAARAIRKVVDYHRFHSGNL